jgi:hypothetical protein
MKPVKNSRILPPIAAAVGLTLIGCSSAAPPNEPETQVAGQRPVGADNGDDREASRIQIPGGQHTQSVFLPSPIPNPWRPPSGEQVEPIPNTWHGGTGEGKNQDPPTGNHHPLYAAEGESVREPR